MKGMTNRPALNFSGKHNLFSPVKWQMNRGAGGVIKVTSGSEVGPSALRIVSTSPLQLTVAFGRAALSGAEVSGYHILVTNELAVAARQRFITQFVGTGATNSQVFILSEVKGPPEAPTEMIAQLKDYNNEKISFAPQKHYTRTVGFEAELKYPVSGKVYSRLRKDSSLDIEGETYKVVDIAASKVVLSDDSNGKRYIIEQMVAP